MPSYLRIALTKDGIDPMIEYLIYNLGPLDEHAADARKGFSLLERRQIECLLEVLQYWQEDPEWDEYCGGDLRKAVEFVRSLTPV